MVFVNKNLETIGKWQILEMVDGMQICYKALIFQMPTKEVGISGDTEISRLAGNMITKTFGLVLKKLREIVGIDYTID